MGWLYLSIRQPKEGSSIWEGERKFRLKNHVFAEKHKNEGRNHFVDRENNIVKGRNDFVDRRNNIADGRGDFADRQNNFDDGRNHFAERENNIADERNGFGGPQCRFTDIPEQPDDYIFMAVCRGQSGINRVSVTFLYIYIFCTP